MRVGIVGFSNIRYIPYLRSYTAVLDGQGIEYELIYWDRHGLDEEVDSETHVMRVRLDDAVPKMQKIIPMLRYAHFVKRTCLKRNYDFLVFITPIPAVILSRFIGARYAGRYVVDIRDYSLEHNPIYFAALRHVLSKAALRVISSPAFKNFLPPADYILCHNLTVRDTPRPIQRGRRAGKALRVSYMGTVRYFVEIQKFISAIANDDRFVFSVFGTGVDGERLAAHCQAAGVKNAHFRGAYAPSSLEGIYNETDIVFNAYGNSDANTRHLLSIRLYNAAWHCLPIIVSPQTTMATAAGYMGFVADYAKGNVADGLYRWYNELDWDKLRAASTSLLDAANADNNAFKAELIKALYAGGGR